MALLREGKRYAKVMAQAIPTKNHWSTIISQALKRKEGIFPSSSGTTTSRETGSSHTSPSPLFSSVEGDSISGGQPSVSWVILLPGRNRQINPFEKNDQCSVKKRNN